MPDAPEVGRQSEPQLAELVTGIAVDIGLLIRQEIELAKLEIAKTAKRITILLIVVTVGVLVILYGLFFLFYSAIFGLATVLPTWASALIVGGGLTLIGLIFILPALAALSKTEPMPRTTKTMKENKEWLRHIKA